MSGALAIAFVTATLKHLLENRLAEPGVAATVGDASVTASAPDRIPTGAEERSQLNLFLYRVTPDTRWRRLGDADPQGNGGAKRSPPLALDLHYLLTAYGERDLHAEILLGYAVQLLHETPLLTPAMIRAALAPESGATNGQVPAALATVAGATLADRLTPIEIKPEFMSTEETSRLWSSLQARYRPSAGYVASVVLLDAER